MFTEGLSAMVWDYFLWLIFNHDGVVGLAVDDIKLVQDQAALKRMAMQVELALDVERVVPEIIRRRFVRKCETVRPNEGSRNPFKKLVNIESGALSSAAISKALDPELDEIEKVQEAQEQLQKDVHKLRLHVKELRATSSRMEGMMKALLQSQNVRFEEEDFQDAEGT
ncbi:hypothetical protein KUTeg_007392 [Tegillarca granosa]|uniref:Uncharacterized protein n=1 Tax=Tegillarca granosa TaxID=220873 RepID=A0ABQ9FFH7_TEGGR|nr:hypothetical protein KUTeg_007392 [Tegillarca granosa]